MQTLTTPLTAIDPLPGSEKRKIMYLFKCFKILVGAISPMYDVEGYELLLGEAEFEGVAVANSSASVPSPLLDGFSLFLCM